MAKTVSPHNWTKAWREARRDLRRAKSEQDASWARAKMAEAERRLKPDQVAQLRGDEE